MKHSCALFALLLCLLASRAICAQTGTKDPNRDMNSSYFISGNPYYTSLDKNGNHWLFGQCTWYVWGRCAETGWNIGYTGNATDYYNNVLRASGKDLNPQVGDIMCLSLTSNGHVGIVVQVINYNSWVIDEYNINDGAPSNPEWSRETVTRDPSNANRVKGELFNWTTLQGFLHSPVSTPTTDLYVSTGGNNNNSGNSGSPYRDVTYAVSKVVVGSPVTIHVAPGTYGGNFNTGQKKINFVTWGAGTVNIGG